LVNAADELRREFKGGMTIFFSKPFISKGKTIDGLYAVVMEKTQDDSPDDIVQSRAESPAGNDAALQLGRVKKNLFPRPGELHGGGFLPFLLESPDFTRIGMDQAVFIIANEPNPGHGR
jgi:hypothetical protein